MLYLSNLLSVAIAAQAALAAPLESRTAYEVKEVHNVPRKWSSKGRASPSHKLHMQIGLKQANFEELDRHLSEGEKSSTESNRVKLMQIVSDPDHPRYGQHLQVEEIHNLVAPSGETFDLVHEWLLTNGIRDFNYSPAKDWINIYVDVGSAERLLDTEYSIYEHEDGSSLVRTPQWSLPKHLHNLIDTIQPTNSFMRSSPQSTDCEFLQPEQPGG
jgi:tripeptidyl-peptidase-1